MINTDSLTLKLDIQAVIDAINEEVDTFIAYMQEKDPEDREKLEVMFKYRQKDTLNISEKMIKKYERYTEK